MNLVTIAKEYNDNEAQLKRSRLEAAGFHPVLANEAGAVWMGSAISPEAILVQVPDDEAADAQEFLKAPPLDSPE